MLEWPPSLRVRVTMAAAGAAALGGIFSAVVSGNLARHRVEQNENRKLSEVAADFAHEVDEELDEKLEDDPPDERAHFSRVHGAVTPTNIVSHELEDLHYLDPRATVRLADGGAFGAPNIPMPRVGTCDMDAFAKVRACTVTFRGGATLTLAVSTRSESSSFELFRLAMIVGAMVGAAGGAGAAFLLARWTLLPLSDLRRRIHRVDAQQPSVTDLETSMGYPAEVEELRATVVALVARLAEALEQAQSFATRAAHELRTPLAALSAELELLIEEHPESTELDRMHGRLQHLTRLIERLLVLAATPDPLTELGEAVELGDVARLVVAHLGPSQSDRVELTLEGDVYVRGDGELMRTLVENALDNALKYSDGRVKLRVTGEQQWAGFEVHDLGVGLSSETREMAFLAYFRGSEARRRGIAGHGIGLSLIAHVARIHGGSARFVDCPAGTCLKIELPCWNAESCVEDLSCRRASTV